MHFSPSLVVFLAAAASALPRAQEAQQPQPSSNAIATVTRTNNLLNLSQSEKFGVEPDACVPLPEADGQYVNVAAIKGRPIPECTFYPTPKCDGEKVLVTKTFLVPYALDFVPKGVQCTARKG